jgi:hypothetical protein
MPPEEPIVSALKTIPPDLKQAGKNMLLNSTGGAVVYGFTLNEWVAILTAVYFILQIGLILIRYARELPRLWRGWFGKRAPEQ